MINNENLKIMKRIIFILSLIFMCITIFGQQGKQDVLSYKMEELSSANFVKAVDKSGGVCLLPLGILEKHGPALPLGSDIFESREIAFQAAEKDYAVVFPTYYVGQIFEARHQPGTIAYSSELMWKMLEETCQELSRNGLKKIVLVNGHGGNTSFLQYFCQAQLAKKEDYVVVFFRPGNDAELGPEIKSLRKAKLDSHAGEGESAMIYYINPALVDMDALKNESGLDQKRLDALPYAYTGIWWYAKFPNHFASDVNTPNKRLGELLIKSDAGQLSQLVHYLKNNNTIEQLKDEFFKKAQNPMAK